MLQQGVQRDDLRALLAAGLELRLQRLAGLLQAAFHRVELAERDGGVFQRAGDALVPFADRAGAFQHLVGHVLDLFAVQGREQPLQAARAIVLGDTGDM